MNTRETSADAEEMRLRAEIARRMKDRRVYLKLTQEEAAARMRTPEKTYQRWESAKTKFSAPNLMVAAEALNVPVSYFFGEVTEGMHFDESEILHMWRELPQEYRRVVRATIQALHAEVRGHPMQLVSAE